MKASCSTEIFLVLRSVSKHFSAVREGVSGVALQSFVSKIKFQ